MDNPIPSIALAGVVRPVCDAEAGEDPHYIPSIYAVEGDSSSSRPSSEGAVTGSADPLEKHGFSLRSMRSAIAELCSAIKSALDDERGTAEDSLRRAAEILQEMSASEVTIKEEVRGGLSPWQVRKVTNHVEANLDQTIRNENLAALVRLNPSYFGRAFRDSFGEPPHEYVIRRRVERAQGLMLSTDAPLSAIALDCGLADQAHLSRLFRRVVGETPRAWRRARIGEPVEYT